MESGGGDLFRSGIGKHVAGELLDGELIESFIGVERFDDVVAVGPDGAVAVFFVTVGVGVAGKVEPMATPAFAKPRGCKKFVDDDSEGLGSWVSGELVGNFDGRRKADEVEVDAADEGEGIGLVSEVVFYEVINGVDVGGDGRFFGQDEGPMFFVLRALSDPLFEEGDLDGREGLVGLGGRHDFIRVVGGDAGDDFVPISGCRRCRDGGPALRMGLPFSPLPSSGPWHLKQLADRMGRICFENETFSVFSADRLPVAPEMRETRRSFLSRREKDIVKLG